MSRLLHRDLVPASALVLIGAYALWEARLMTTFGAIFPNLAGLGMVLGGLALAVRALLFQPPAPAPNGAIGRPLLLLVALFVWAVMLPITGFVPTSLVAVLIVISIATQEQKSWKTQAGQFLCLAGLVGVVALVFGTLLKVPLP